MYVNVEALSQSEQSGGQQRFSYPEADGILALQFQGALSFANGDLFRSKIIKALDVAEDKNSHSQIHTIVLGTDTHILSLSLSLLSDPFPVFLTPCRYVDGNRL
eukprot:TRINITY_DN5491_c0_g2_i14.p3 TRINITY_DN5491_c0_g2~~TRINITY_DN5491_c0_g2_i14.p3  ORF type:complete len:104 (+),score=27.34 TRINITY_DN5491_c0_g2_i14:68-379(+)